MESNGFWLTFITLNTDSTNENNSWRYVWESCGGKSLKKWSIVSLKGKSGDRKSVSNLSCSLCIGKYDVLLINDLDISSKT